MKPEVTQSPVTRKVKEPGQGYVDPLLAVQRAPMRGPGPVKYYECADCQELYERLRKAFQEIGYEF